MNQTDPKGGLKEPKLGLIFLAYLIVAGLSFNRGILPSDEGYQLYFSWLIAQGQKIYKDFFLQVAPLSFLLQALLIKLFGARLIVPKIFALLMGIIGFFSIAYISRKVASGKFWLMGPALYIFFSNTLFNYSHYSLESKFFLILSLSFALYWYDSQSLSAMFLAGFFAGVASLSYQSFSIIAGLEFFGFLIWRDRGKSPGWLKPALAFLGGFLLISLSLGIYLGQKGLMEETFRALLYSARTKTHIYHFFLALLFPFLLISGLSTVVLKKLWELRGIWRVVATIILVLAFIFLMNFWREHPDLFLHLMALVMVVVLFSLSGAYLREQKAKAKSWLIFGFSVLLLLIGLLSGYDLMHTLNFSILLLPWLGFLMEQWQKKGRENQRIKLGGMVIVAFFLAWGLFLFFTRLHFLGEEKPLYLCNSPLEFKSGRGIYVSKEEKQELENLISMIPKLTKPEEPILVYPNYLLLYYLSGRSSLSRSPYFYYELASLEELKKAVELALAKKVLVIFQLKEGKIFQPLASEKAEELVNNLSSACREKIWLKNYLLCPLG